MNFLGHSRISMEIDIKTMYGNFTGDFYKGRLENLKLPSDVKNGLFLHRKIDSISDTGNILTEKIDKKFSIFRGVISDIIIDHFLALEWEKLFNEDLNDSIKWYTENWTNTGIFIRKISQKFITGYPGITYSILIKILRI